MCPQFAIEGRNDKVTAFEHLNGAARVTRFVLVPQLGTAQVAEQNDGSKSDDQ